MSTLHIYTYISYTYIDSNVRKIRKLFNYRYKFFYFFNFGIACGQYIDQGRWQQWHSMEEHYLLLFVTVQRLSPNIYSVIFYTSFCCTEVNKGLN